MKAKIKRSEYIAWYLTLWNGFLELTARETAILIEFIKLHDSLVGQISNPEILNSQLFSSNSRKKVRELLGITSENLFNNYFSSLKAKGVIEKSGDSYKLSENIIPKQKISFEVEFID